MSAGGSFAARLVKIRSMVLCGQFAALIAVGAFIRIPVPFLPFTLQFLFTTLAGLVLGPRLGAASVLLYILLGLSGLPVFTMGGGPSYVFQPTFGYLAGFCAGAYVSGLVAGREAAPSIKRLIAADFAGLAVVYAMGIAYYWFISKYYTGSPAGWKILFVYCFALAVPGDILLCVLGAFLGRRLRPVIGRFRDGH